MEVTYPSETLADFRRTIPRYFLEDTNVHNPGFENLKSYI
jgi:hypothetical protein